MTSASRSLPWPAIERWLIVLIAAHSVGVGLMLMLVPHWAVQFAGWHGADPLFFIHQAGAFHFVLAAGYLVEHFRHRTAVLLTIAKATAFVFLLGATLLIEVPWSVPFSGVADGAMGAAVLLVRRLGRLSR